jgi:hypothetical protein
MWMICGLHSIGHWNSKNRILSVLAVSQCDKNETLVGTTCADWIFIRQEFGRTVLLVGESWLRKFLNKYLICRWNGYTKKFIL